MITNLYWNKFSDIAIKRLVNPEKGKPLIVLADTTNDLQLAESLLAAADNAGADAQLIIKPRSGPGMATNPGPILSSAFKNAKYIVSICDDGFDASDSIQEAISSNGTRILITKVDGIEKNIMVIILLGQMVGVVIF